MRIGGAPSFSSSDIALTVSDYLDERHFVRTKATFIEECFELREILKFRGDLKSLVTSSLEDMLNEYLTMKKWIDDILLLAFEPDELPLYKSDGALRKLKVLGDHLIDKKSKEPIRPAIESPEKCNLFSFNDSKRRLSTSPKDLSPSGRKSSPKVDKKIKQQSLTFKTPGSTDVSEDKNEFKMVFRSPTPPSSQVSIFDNLEFPAHEDVFADLTIVESPVSKKRPVPYKHTKKTPKSSASAAKRKLSHSKPSRSSSLCFENSLRDYKMKQFQTGLKVALDPYVMDDNVVIDLSNVPCAPEPAYTSGTLNTLCDIARCLYSEPITSTVKPSEQPLPDKSLKYKASEKPKKIDAVSSSKINKKF